jgi:hypothetical protein
MKRVRVKETSCEAVIGLLSDFAEGELEGASQERVRKHLTSCSACRNEAELIKGVIERLQELEPLVVPVDMAKRVTESLRVQSRANRPQLTIFEQLTAFLAPRRGVLVVAGCACLLLLAILPIVRGPSTRGVLVARLEHPVRDQLGGLQLSAGEVDFQRMENGAASSSGQVLKVGTRFVVAAGNTALLNFQDGSSVVAGDQAVVHVAKDAMRLERGRLDLTMSPNGLGFAVTTPQAEVVVCGTVYSVHVDEEGTHVRVKRGKVSVASTRTGEEVLLRAGENARVDTKGILTRTTVRSASQAGQSEDTRLGADDEN